MDRMLARTRTVAWLMFFTGCLGAWVLLFIWSSEMRVDLWGFPQLMPAMPSNEMPPASDTAMTGMGGAGAMSGMMVMDGFTNLFLMWAVMMAAMMLPSFVPTARTFMDLVEAEIARPIGLAGLTTGYCIIWVGVAAVLTLAQLLFIALGLTGGMGQSLSPWFSATLLIVAGAYQFTDLKERCAQHCRSPMSMFLANFRPGMQGGIRLGLATGAYCVGCCWGLMAIGFAGGMMSLVWMGLATVLMTLEKLPQLGGWLTRPIGIGLLAIGAWVAARALIG